MCVCVCVYDNFVVVPVVSVDTRIIFMYVYYTVVLVPGDPLRSYRGNLKNTCVCILHYRNGACS